MPVCVWNLSMWVWGAAHDVAGCERCRAERVAAACGLRLLRGPFWTGWGRRAGRALNALPGLLSLQAGAASYLEQRRQLLHLAVWRVGATAPLGWRWGGFRGGGACAPWAAPAYALGKFPPLCVALPEGGNGVSATEGWRGFLVRRAHYAPALVGRSGRSDGILMAEVGVSPATLA